ncbi:MAG: tetratricopeptide repeat protein [Candidatus Cloacimonadota bacterium]|nr:MAG: tetratricopeptide repeat protein [Candidatus Cloacimonadota bacterium]
MKKSYGIDTRIRSDKGDYLIETYADSRQFKVISELFFEGKILEIKEVPYEPTISEESLIRLIQKLQNSVIVDLENLFDLNESMKKKATAEGLYKIGRLFFKRKLIDRAKSTYEESLKLNPNYADAYRDLGRIMALLDEYKEAEAYLLMATRIKPERADYHFYHGRILFDSGRSNEAEKEFSKALELNSDYAEAYFYHGVVLLKEIMSNTEETIDDNKMITVKVDLKNASVLDERFRGKSFNNAFTLLENMSYKEALKRFLEFSGRFTEIEAHDVIDEFDIFSKYSKKKISLLTVDEYINGILSLLEEHPEFADLHNSLGKAYILKVRALLNASSLEFKKALEINPDYEEAEKNLELVENEGKGFLLLLRAILK